MTPMLVTEDTSQLSRGWLKEAALWNIPFMSVTLEVSQAEMLPLKRKAPRNILDMSDTPERSGESVALYIMLLAPLNADSMDDHCVAPHWSMLFSFWALAESLPRCILVKSPEIRTV